MAAAKRIINVDLERKLILNKKTLKEILKDDIKDLPVVVISIVGTYRQGKSFLMNFFLRFLTLTCKEKRSVDEWFDPNDGTLSGFIWKHGSQMETVGIMMWPEIFISKLPSGEEVAIILLDTQGTYDNRTSVQHFATIFALSTLISSVQIYNMMNTIKQNELTSLKDFLDYGQLVNEEQSGAPFQNLIFLIRDWLHASEHPYGEVGGEDYLQKELGYDPMDDEGLTALKQSVFQFFSKTSAFLLPAPGDSVVKKGTNNLAEMDPEFKTFVKLLVEKILKPENLLVKEVNGKRVRVSDLFILIEKYHEQLQSGKMPPIRSLFQASAEAQHQSAVEDCVKIYEDSMSFDKDPESPAEDEASFRTRHESKKQSTLEEFDQMKKLGDEQTQRKYREKLIERIETAFLIYENVNQMKLEREERQRVKEELVKQNEDKDKALVVLKGQFENAKVENEQGRKEREQIERRLREQELERNDNERRIQEIEERKQKLAFTMQIVAKGLEAVSYFGGKYLKHKTKLEIEKIRTQGNQSMVDEYDWNITDSEDSYDSSDDDSDDHHRYRPIKHF